MPRHPPCALKNLATKMLASTVQFSNNKPTPPRTPTPAPTTKDEPVCRPGQPGRNTKTRTTPGKPKGNTGLVVSGPNSVPTNPRPPAVHVPTQSQHPTPEGDQTPGGAVLANEQAIQDPKSQRPHMSTTTTHKAVKWPLNNTAPTHNGPVNHDCQLLLRKEVIQPHLPVRLPCYDFVPIADPTFDSSLPYGLGHRLRVLPTFVT